MKTKMRCQSCGMPLGEGFYGTEKDGQVNKEYCKFCFQNGSFTHPTETVSSMVRKSIDNMVNELSIPEDQARELANSFIPKLKRWESKYEK